MVGEVVDGDGRPVAGAVVYFALHFDYGRGGRLIGRVETKPDGSFGFPGDPKGYWLPDVEALAVAPDGRMALSHIFSKREVVMRMPDLSTVRVRLEDASGGPVAGESVQFEPMDSRIDWAPFPELTPLLTRKTDDRGECSISYGLEVMAGIKDDRFDLWNGALVPSIYFPQSGRTIDQRFVLKAPGAIVGRVIHAPDGGPIEGVRIDAMWLGSPSEPATGLLPRFTARSEKDGSYRLAGLREGDYWIFATAPSYSDIRISPGSPDNVGYMFACSASDGETSQALVISLADPARVSCLVEGAQDVPLSGVNVTVLSAEAPHNELETLKSNKSGVCRFLLQPGTYDFCVHSDHRVLTLHAGESRSIIFQRR